MVRPLAILAGAGRFGGLLRSQYASPADLERLVGRKLELTLAAAWQIPFYRHRFGAPRAPADARAQLMRLPLLERSQIADLAASVRSRLGGRVPAHSARSSGSTGTPVELLFDTSHEAGRLASWARAFTAHGWWPGRRTAWVIHLPETRARSPLVRLFSRLGSRFVSQFESVAEQRRVLERLDPTYLVSIPSQLDALLHDGPLRLPSLRRVFSGGELLDDDLRARVEAAWGASVVDLYGAVEASIAWQCPRGSLHLNAEHVLVEIVDDAGRPLAPGALGRVVLTTLDNHLMPLVRYALGDLACARAVPCACGRTLPSLQGVAGRTVSFFRAPGGARFSPWQLVVALNAPRRLTAFQLVQEDLRRFRVRYVADAPLDEAARAELGAHFLERLQACAPGDAPATLGWERVERLDRGPGGKFLAAVCELERR